MKHYKIFSALTNEQNLALRQNYNILVRNATRCCTKNTMYRLLADSNYYCFVRVVKQGRKIIHRHLIITPRTMGVNNHYNMGCL